MFISQKKGDLRKQKGDEENGRDLEIFERGGEKEGEREEEKERRERGREVGRGNRNGSKPHTQNLSLSLFPPRSPDSSMNKQKQTLKNDTDHYDCTTFLAITYWTDRQRKSLLLSPSLPSPPLPRFQTLPPDDFFIFFCELLREHTRTSKNFRLIPDPQLRVRPSSVELVENPEEKDASQSLREWG